jgi:hypothetical protein
MAEAARRLGVTSTAVRHRVKRGTLPTRPNGNHGKLVLVPRGGTVPTTVPVTGSERVTETVLERVGITVLTKHIENLQAALAQVEAKAEAAAERARLAEIEAAAVPALRDAVAALQQDRDRWFEAAQRLLPTPATPEPATPWRRFLRWRKAAG